MSVLAKLGEQGLDVEFEALVGQYLASEEDEASAKALRDTVDEHGLKSPKTMKMIGSLQKNGKLKPGLYKEFVALHTRSEAGEVAPTTTSEADSPQETKKEEVMPDNVVDIKGKFSESDEAKIRERMAKEEENWRKRQVEREKKMRQRLLERDEKRAQRQGMNLETIQGIKERQDTIKENTDKMKVYRDENKKLREEVRDLRPKRQKKAS